MINSKKQLNEIVRNFSKENAITSVSQLAAIIDLCSKAGIKFSVDVNYDEVFSSFKTNKFPEWNDAVANREIELLANQGKYEEALGKASMNDAYHIAIASVNRLDCLVSWNFKHIVNFDKIKLFNSINLKLGYPLIDIRTPLEFLKYED